MPAALPQGKENKHGRTLTDLRPLSPVSATTKSPTIRVTDLMIANAWADNCTMRTSLFFVRSPGLVPQQHLGEPNGSPIAPLRADQIESDGWCITCTRLSVTRPT